MGILNVAKKMEHAEHHQEKINPFKELPKPQQPHLNTAHTSTSSLASSHSPASKDPAKEITITIKPWKLAKWSLVVLVLLAVFMAGRWSTGASSFSLPDFSSAFSHEASPSGLVTGDTQVNESAPESGTAEVQAPVAAVNDSASPVASNNGSVSNKTLETFVDTGYSKVTLSLDNVYKDWKGTWGKIKGVEYTIINHEDGTIKPHHFTLSVEGYTDHGEKSFDVSYTSQKVKAGQTLKDESAVSGGFPYSSTQIPDGDLKHVTITLALIDEDSEVISTTQQDVDLSGDTETK